MDQPGVEVRPIKEMTGEALFNEVFFTDARTAKDNVVGEVNNGWTVANTLLGFERGGRSTVLALGYRSELDAIVELARRKGVHTTTRHPPTPGLGPQPGRDHALPRHAVADQGLTGEQPGPRGVDHQAVLERVPQARHRAVARHPRRRPAMVPSGDTGGSSIQAFSGGRTVVGGCSAVFLGARPGTIYAGTSQVQRNIIGERVLGLPKEPRADTGPWNERSG
jgi:alkylation response protein AidB-like acyl-CoA dehydrogenase